MSSFLPIFLNLQNKEILLVGGGGVALEKLEKLLKTGAHVLVVSRDFSSSFLHFVGSLGPTNNVTPQQREFHSNDVLGKFLVISAVNDLSVHAQVVRAARDHGILVNSVDEPSLADFYFAAQIDRGPLQIAFSTSGTFPGVARALRIWLEELLPESLGHELLQLNLLRKELKLLIPDAKERMKSLKHQLQLWQSQIGSIKTKRSISDQ